MRTALEDLKTAAKKEYDEELRTLVENVKHEIRNENLVDSEGLQVWIHEKLDGHTRIANVADAQLGLLVSENSGAAIANYGSAGLVEDGSLEWSRLMYPAMERDLIDALTSAGIHPNGDLKKWREALGL